MRFVPINHRSFIAMSRESLSSIVVDILENNKGVAKSIIGAHRQVGARISDLKLCRAFGYRGEQVTDLLKAGIGKASDGVEFALDKFYDQASKTFVKVADTVNGVGDKYAPTYLNLARNVTLPGARVAREVSVRLASRANKIYPVGIGKAAAKSVRKSSKQARVTK
jgi:hypothetical protein